MDAVKLYQKYTVEELTAKIDAIKQNPTNQTPGQFYLYTKAARCKIDQLVWAITYHLYDARKKAEE